ncbi:hypothetical protein SRHO_G00244210 [Serrasalmus rhombeus]
MGMHAGIPSCRRAVSLMFACVYDLSLPSPFHPTQNPGGESGPGFAVDGWHAVAISIATAQKFSLSPKPRFIGSIQHESL